jgi:hypothetical protein
MGGLFTREDDSLTLSDSIFDAVGNPNARRRLFDYVVELRRENRTFRLRIADLEKQLRGLGNEPTATPTEETRQ